MSEENRLGSRRVLCNEADSRPKKRMPIQSSIPVHPHSPLINGRLVTSLPGLKFSYVTKSGEQDAVLTFYLDATSYLAMDSDHDAQALAPSSEVFTHYLLPIKTS